jgi:hypothetical protein
MQFKTNSGTIFEIPTPWWEEARMPDFTPRGTAYTPTTTDHILFVPICEIRAPSRTRGLTGLSRDGFDAQRMTSILTALFGDIPLPAVDVTANATGAFRYNLYHGMHRFYASAAVGFSHLPVLVIVDNVSAFLDAETAAANAWRDAHR